MLMTNTLTNYWSYRRQLLVIKNDTNVNNS